MVAVKNHSEASWLYELLNHEVLSDSVHRELIEKYRADGDLEARNSLVLHSQRWIFSIVQNSIPCKSINRVGLMELQLAGNIGLMLAVDKFDAGRENSFFTYAAFWIRAVTLDLAKSTRSVLHYSRGAQERVRKLRAGKYSILRQPEKLRLDGYRYRKVYTQVCAARAESAPIFVTDTVAARFLVDTGLVPDIGQALEYDGAAKVADVLPDEREGADDQLDGFRREERVRDRWEKVSPDLSPRDRFIIENRWLADRKKRMTLQEIGLKFGVTREAIRQAEVSLRNRLRAAFVGFDE